MKIVDTTLTVQICLTVLFFLANSFAQNKIRHERNIAILWLCFIANLSQIQKCQLAGNTLEEQGGGGVKKCARKKNCASSPWVRGEGRGVTMTL
jgi:hypothetical protein